MYVYVCMYNAYVCICCSVMYCHNVLSLYGFGVCWNVAGNAGLAHGYNGGDVLFDGVAGYEVAAGGGGDAFAAVAAIGEYICSPIYKLNSDFNIGHIRQALQVL